MKNFYAIGFSLAIAAGLSARVNAENSNKESIEENNVQCIGINQCRGYSECKTARNACKGQNECKGQGWLYAQSEGDCQRKGGNLMPRS